MRHRAFLFVAAGAFAAVVAVYSNHFVNSFHFDDFHTITDNPYVHNVQNFPRFFTDAHTFSILPDHASYRPLVTTSLAIDYWLSKGPNPLWFHISTFCWFLLQLALMYLLFESVMDAAAPDARNRWYALFATALYGLHPVSAETVNYIIQRAEIYSSVGVIAGLVLYIRFPKLRRTGVYLAPVILGILSKPPAAVFAGILFVYIFLFEENRRLAPSIKRCIPALIACLAAGAFVLHMEAGTFKPGGDNPFLYRLTQPSVTWHYFRSFFWPSSLSADSDFKLVDGFADLRVIFGLIFVVALCAVAWISARTPRTRPIAFGIAWFLMALLPVAWVPLSEVENDHRMFFPFVGLALAVVWTVRLFTGSDVRSLAVSAVLVLAVCAYGTHQRNQVWRTEESLWRDVTEKSPLNGRGHMNYGLTQMSKGDYTAALASFNRALPLTPNYSTLHINIAIADGGLGRDSDAEKHFAQALALAPDDSQPYYYYARWLSEHGRTPQAVALAEAGVQKNPADMQCRTLLLQLYVNQRDYGKMDALLADSLRIAPGDPDLMRFRLMRASTPPATSAAAKQTQTAENLLNLSLTFYQAGRYEECIKAAQKALLLNPNYPEAYNNIAAAWNAMGRYEEGIQAAAQAVRLKPDFRLARNNLAWAQSQLARSHHAAAQP